MKKYVCNMKKEEIINAIIEEFEKVLNDYDDAVENNWSKELQAINQGRYIAMIDLLQKVAIYDK